MTGSEGRRAFAIQDRVATRVVPGLTYPSVTCFRQVRSNDPPLQAGVHRPMKHHSSLHPRGTAVHRRFFAFVGVEGARGRARQEPALTALFCGTGGHEVRPDNATTGRTPHTRCGATPLAEAWAEPADVARIGKDRPYGPLSPKTALLGTGIGGCDTDSGDIPRSAAPVAAVHPGPPQGRHYGSNPTLIPRIP